MGNYYETFYPPARPVISPARRILARNNNSYERPDDDIVADLRDHLDSFAGIDTINVSVDSHAGSVTLRGEVKSLAVANFVAKVAENTHGVRDVRTELVIRGVAH